MAPLFFLMNVYQDIVEALSRGERVWVDILTKILVLNGEALIVDGVAQRPLGVEPMACSAALAMLEEAYANYKYSLPNSDSEAKQHRTAQRSLFGALSADEVPDEWIVHGMWRHEARVRLEALFLILVANGSIRTDSPEFAGKWFWQSEKDKDFVILTKWI